MTQSLWESMLYGCLVGAFASLCCFVLGKLLAKLRTNKPSSAEAPQKNRFSHPLLLGALFLLTAAFYVLINNKSQEPIPNLTSTANSQLIRELYKVSDEINKEVPKMMSEGIRLDKAIPGPGAELTYLYTFVNYDKPTLDEREARSLKERVTALICTNQKMKPSLYRGVQYTYKYYSNAGAELINFSVNQNVCRSLSSNVAP